MPVHATMPSPVGPLLLVGEREGTGVRLTALHLGDEWDLPAPGAGWEEDPAAFAEVRRQLAEYFAGRRTAFDLPLAPAGTPFQLRVWEELRRVPAGTTVSYGELAARAGRPGAARAVGGALNRNPIGIVVPCHRVVGADGTLTGYAGGLGRKQVLLDLERGMALPA